ncbi:MAG: patatin-like phospholipase family protein [Prevotella sp.]|nr:patatin-like phospholipase family protein [Prevotella sp.]
MLRLLLCLLLLTPLSPSRAQTVGLVLGGGGARGGAEVGVLKALEEAGVRPDYIVGTSIGAIVGGLYAAGYSAAELEQMFCQQEWLSLLTDRRSDLSGEPLKQEGGTTYIFGFPVIDTTNPQFGVLSGARVEQLLDSMLSAKGCSHFSNLPTPFRCVAAEMLQAKEVVLSSGSVAKSIRASMAIPGIFKPVRLNGQQLVDGGMMNNLPVDVARTMGADIIIAVDLQQSAMQNRTQTENIITSFADLIGLGGIANWVFNRPDITKYNANRRSADVYIQPLMSDYDASSFGNENMRHMIAIGYQAAKRHEQQLRQMLPAI